MWKFGFTCMYMSIFETICICLLLYLFCLLVRKTLFSVFLISLCVITLGWWWTPLFLFLQWKNQLKEDDISYSYLHQKIKGITIWCSLTHWSLLWSMHLRMCTYTDVCLFLSLYVNITWMYLCMGHTFDSLFFQIFDSFSQGENMRSKSLMKKLSSCEVFK